MTDDRFAGAARRARIGARRLCAALGLAAAATAHAGGPAPFDLAGPQLDMVVRRGDLILPAAEVPSLAAGDRIWIKPDFPSRQSARYLMVAAFLSGPTNPPPPEWFFACKTWTGDCARDGLTVTVPDGAQQALVFLAPETSGDLKGIVTAVRSRPGAFVRATQDLNQAQLDRSRLERYLAAVHALERSEPAALRQAAPLLARSLAIEVDEKCLDRIPQLQAACLTQKQDGLILGDAHSMSIAATLASGPVADLVMAASATPELGYGVYSPYIASVLDLLRIFDSFSSAQYQYIPALVSHRDRKLALTLNTPPSFGTPKSVLVVALPTVGPAQPPPLRAVNPTDIHCASRSELVLPVEGAPLAFSTRFAHDLTLTLTGDDGQTVRLPAYADAARGGYVVSTAALRAAQLGDVVTGRLEGYWGFDYYRGPGFRLGNARALTWALSAADDGALIAGRPDTVLLQADSTSCVDRILLRDPNGRTLQAQWKLHGPGQVEVTLPLQDVEAGTMDVLIDQAGIREPQAIPVRVFSGSVRLDHLRLHTGDTQATLSGARLDQVERLTLGDVDFVPGALSTLGNDDRLTLDAVDPDAAALLQPGSAPPVRVLLRDGRSRPVKTTIEAPRPQVSLIGKNVQRPETASPARFELGHPDQLPQDARLVFSIRRLGSATFTRDDVVEVAAVDDSFSTLLGIANGRLRLENGRVALATLDPDAVFGLSAFGPLKFRLRARDIAGDWQPLATLVRLPQLTDLSCPAEPDRACRLSGRDLFLIDAVSAAATFEPAVHVPDGFPGSSLPVPHPENGALHLRLRDDPATAVVARFAVADAPVAATPAPTSAPEATAPPQATPPPP